MATLYRHKSTGEHFVLFKTRQGERYLKKFQHPYSIGIRLTEGGKYSLKNLIAERECQPSEHFGNGCFFWSEDFL